MALVNDRSKEINCKIVYYGPGLGGKTTNIQHIYEKTHQGKKSPMSKLDTENERTIFFDFLPLDIGDIKGYKTRFHLYTVPGQVVYEPSRKLILRGVDGVVFVADSQVTRMQENVESWKSLRQNLESQGHDLKKIPVIFQWNKRDMSNIAPIEEMSKQLNDLHYPEIEAVAQKGQGVFETLKLVSKLVLANIRSGLV
jgi:signal recognition particle receptor subunit beta